MTKASRSANDFGREGNFRMLFEGGNKTLFSVRNLNYVQLTGARTVRIDGFPWDACLIRKEYFI